MSNISVISELPALDSQIGIIDLRPPFYFQKMHIHEGCTPHVFNIYIHGKKELSERTLAQYPAELVQPCRDRLLDLLAKGDLSTLVVIPHFPRQNKSFSGVFFDPLISKKNVGAEQNSHMTDVEIILKSLALQGWSGRTETLGIDFASYIQSHPTLISQGEAKQGSTVFATTESKKEQDPQRANLLNHQSPTPVLETEDVKEEQKGKQALPAMGRFGPVRRRHPVEHPKVPPFVERIPLSPIQQWFFSLRHPNENWFNQDGRFQVNPNEVKLEFLETALRRLVLRHGAFRTRFVDLQPRARADVTLPRDIFQMTLPPAHRSDQVFHQIFEFHNLASLSQQAQKDEMASIISKAHCTLDIEDGPIGKIVVFDVGTDFFIMIVLHHLVVDGVSWRILQTNLDQLVREALHEELASQQLEKIAQGTSWAQWVKLQRRQASSFLNYVEYWEEKARFPLLVWDSPSSLDSNVKGEDARSFQASYQLGVAADFRNGTVTVHFDLATTTRILRQYPKKFGTRINDVLLMAFSSALAKWTGRSQVGLLLESHGREEILGGAVSECVSWFTTMYPVILTITPQPDPAVALHAIKEQLDSIPENGISFGILRYLTPEGEARLNFPLPQVSFNYLGQLGFPEEKNSINNSQLHSKNGRENDKENDTPLVVAARSVIGPVPVPPQLLNHVLLNVNGMAGPTGLTFTFDYCQFAFARATIQKVAAHFEHLILLLGDTL